MVKVREDLTGKTFGRLLVIKQVEDYISPKGMHYMDRNPLNNRRYNLRVANNSQNAQNRGLRFDNTSGVIGVSYHKTRQTYIARISDYPYHRIVVYEGDDKKEAIIARLQAEQKYYGEFAPQKHLFKEYGIETTQND